MEPPVALILGAGANVGQAVARAFTAEGYRIALVARSAPKEDSDQKSNVLHIRGDLSEPSSVAGIFAQVKAQLGVPQVVVYNAAAGRPTGGDPLSLALSDFVQILAINTTSVYAAAQEAVAGFQELSSSFSLSSSSSSGGIFIFTGNMYNVKPAPAKTAVSVGKSATATLIQCAVESHAFAAQGIRFYYADERTADGSPVYGAVDGGAHAALYTSLARSPTQGPWQQTFVKGVGYKVFRAVQ